MENVAVLGATGSIGASTLAVIALYPERFRVRSLSAGSNTRKLAALAARYHPRRVAVADAKLLGDLRAELAAFGVPEVEALAGPGAVEELARDPGADTVVQAVVGAAGVRPSFAAAEAGKRLLLANKESVVCGGGLLMEAVRAGGGTLLPVDSEHNAVFQCLAAAGASGRKAARIWLTCSGGPFRTRKDLDLSTVTPEMALAHPTWSMGRKITIDSATLMNKGLEVIEARHLFSIPQGRIKVVIHPQSVVHSMVEFGDGAFIAQLGPADMRLAIAYCLGWPERLPGGEEPLNPFLMQSLAFEEPQVDRFPQLGLAYEALDRGGEACIYLNAANEIGVNAFLERRIRFTDIAVLCRRVMEAAPSQALADVDGVMAADARARALSREALPPL